LPHRSAEPCSGAVKLIDGPEYMTVKTESDESQKASEPTFGSFIPYRIAELSHNTNMLITDYLVQMNLTLPQWRVLVVLNHFSKLGIGEISKKALIRQSTLSRVVDRMEDMKLVKRSQKSENRRQVQVSLSKKGQETYDKISPIAQSLHDLLSSALTDEEQQSLFLILDKLTSKLEEGRLGIK
jgi:MarR family transcriptional regulator, organic hydroperoxide resistance regulator